MALIVSLLVATAQMSTLPLVSPMFSDNMVLQRGSRSPVWGWAAPGSEISVSIAGHNASAHAGADGRWMLGVGPLAVGGPYDLTVSDGKTVTFHNVLIGDVWVCSGQSNMEFGIGNGLNAKQEIAAANFPNLRLFCVPKEIAVSSQIVIGSSQNVNEGSWKICSPDTVGVDGDWGGFSAVAYFFGRKLNQDLNVPIGLIHTSWGGTPAEAWTDPATLAERVPAYRENVAALAALKDDNRSTAERYADWYRANDAGITATPRWFDPALDDSSWKSIAVPGYFQDAGLPELVNNRSVVWYRLATDALNKFAGQDVTISFHADDNDTTWFNGSQIGATDGVTIPRNYKIPGSAIKSGSNELVIRVTDTGQPGGIYGTGEPIVTGPDGSKLSLAGQWKVKLGAVIGPKNPLPQSVNSNPNYPTVLYNGMIAPILPYGIKGAIWYQGESNSGRSFEYRTLLPAMISSWRKGFRQGDFPFLIVELAGFGQAHDPGDDGWAELREAQELTARTVRNAGVATAIDIGDSADIHPKNKQEVGRRLALVAERQVYGRDVTFTGPVYKSMSVEGSRVRITFDHTEGGLVVRGAGPLHYFQVAGADHKWVWAEARIEGDSVVVSSAQIPEPVAVRYSWASYSESNLENGQGWPAFPFRTDNWPGVTWPKN